MFLSCHMSNYRFSGSKNKNFRSKNNFLHSDQHATNWSGFLGSTLRLFSAKCLIIGSINKNLGLEKKLSFLTSMLLNHLAS